MAVNVHIGGVTKLSTVDYPGELAAVVYVKGCNMRCPYCHNRALVENEGGEMPEELVSKWLVSQRDRLTAVVITGGEPLLYSGWLLRFIQRMRWQNYKVKVDTNGLCLNQERAESLAPYVDRLAVDMKGPAFKARLFTGDKAEDMSVGAGINAMYGALNYMHYFKDVEFRTTVHKSILDEMDLETMCRCIHSACPGRPWYLQLFRQCDCFDKSLNDQENYTPEELYNIAVKLGAMTRGCGDYDDLSREKWQSRPDEPRVVVPSEVLGCAPGDARALHVAQGYTADSGVEACRPSE